MKKSADKSKSEGENNIPKQRKTSSKNGEIETYLSSYYEFRYNTVLGRTEYRDKDDTHFSKVGRYEINTLRRELDNDVGIVTSSDNLYSIIESSFSPRVNPIQEYFNGLPLRDIGNISGNNSGKRVVSLKVCNSSFLSLYFHCYFILFFPVFELIYSPFICLLCFLHRHGCQEEDDRLL